MAQNLESLSQSGYRQFRRTGIYQLDNAKNDKGFFETLDALNNAYNTGFNGWFATVGEYDNIYMWDSDTNKWKSTSITGNTANNLVPRTNVNYNSNIGVQLDRYNGTYYNILVLTGNTGTTNITIASGSLIGGGAILLIRTNGKTITITGASIDPKSDTASPVSGNTDKYIFWKEAPNPENLTGIYYSIVNLS